MPFFPRILVEFIRLKDSAGHLAGRRGGVQIALNTLPQGIEWFAGHPQLACDAVP